MPGALTGRLAVITGGDSGIGAGCVRALGMAGCDVAILTKEMTSDAEDLVAELAAAGRRASIVRADVASEADVERAFDNVMGSLGVPDILINSAGIDMNGTPVAAMTLAQWEGLLRVDLTGSFLTSRRFIRERGERDGPATIINVTSIHAFAMRAGGADYTAAKGGQANLTRTLALECAERNITVNAIAPGFISTAMNEGDEGKAVETVPLRRAGTADEVGRIAAFLAGPDAAYVTGATLVVDGGLSLLMGQGA